MTYDIFDSTGNLVESFDDEALARAALAKFVRDEPDAAEHVALIAFDDSGMPADDAAFAEAPTAVR